MRLDWSRADEYRLRLVDASGRAMGEGRSVGTHLSDILNFIEANLEENKFPREPIPAEIDQRAGLQFAQLMGGFVLEECIDHAFRSWAVKSLQLVDAQRELFVDGVYMTNDGRDGERQVIFEMKSTRKSRRKMDEALQLHESEGDTSLLMQHFWRWMMQVMAYAYHSGCTKVCLVVWWMRGNYTWKPGGEEDVRLYPLEFSAEELEANWKNLLAWKARMDTANNERKVA